MPFSRSICTTFASVAIEAWSVPGTQQAFFPSILARLTKISCMVLLRQWPMCNTPVTFGGGITMVYGSLASGVLLKYPLSSQCWYHFASIAVGSKFLLSSMGAKIRNDLGFMIWDLGFIAGSIIEPSFPNQYKHTGNH